MDLKVTIKNLGKLTDAEIRISKFTVFAGVNDTGKSFASKALYSRLSSSLDDSHVLHILELYAHQLQRGVKGLKNEGFDDENFPLLLQHLDKFNEIISEIKGVDAYDKIPAFEKKISDIINTCKSVGGVSAAMMNKIEFHDLMCQGGKDKEKGREFDFDIFKKSSKFFEIMTEDEIRKIFTSNIKNMFDRNLLRNFQAEALSDLKIDKGKKTSIEIDAKSLMFQQEEYVKDYLNNENYSNLGILHTFITNRALFLGSPLFWQLKSSLRSAGRYGPMRLSGVPKYFFDMVDELDGAYIGEPIAPDVLERLTGENVINGKVSVASTGEMVYTANNGETLPLVQAATGIANLGVLALLIEKKILDKNTFLFIDEPEAHLHPAWQVEMVESLFKLAEAGVHVIIATHSAEILKWLEVHVKENPEAKEMIELNHFHKDGNVESNGRDFDERLNTIQKELAMPYYSLFYRGL